MTVAVGGWYFVLRGSGEPSGDFLVAESRFVSAAREIPTAAADVHRMLDLAAFDDTFAASIATMKAQVAVFKRLGRDEEGQALSVAQSSQTAAQTAVTTASVFQDALHRNRFADARTAKSELESAVRKLEKNANEWKKL